MSKLFLRSASLGLAGNFHRKSRVLSGLFWIIVRRVRRMRQGAPRLETPLVFPSRRSAVAQRRCACKQLCDARPPRCLSMIFRCRENARRQHAPN